MGTVQGDSQFLQQSSWLKPLGVQPKAQQNHPISHVAPSHFPPLHSVLYSLPAAPLLPSAGSSRHLKTQLPWGPSSITGSRWSVWKLLSNNSFFVNTPAWLHCMVSGGQMCFLCAFPCLMWELMATCKFWLPARCNLEAELTDTAAIFIAGRRAM